MKERAGKIFVVEAVDRQKGGVPTLGEYLMVHEHGYIGPYRPEDDPKPLHWLWEINVDDVSNLAKAILDDLHVELTAVSLDDLAIQNILEHMNKMSAINIQVSATSALIGSPGTAKSSLINALLHCSELANARNSTATTNIPFVYEGTADPKIWLKTTIPFCQSDSNSCIDD